MILSNAHIDINIEAFNPSITLCDNLKKRSYSFPDPNSYYILSPAGKNFSVMENSTILLNTDKGYFEPLFTIEDVGAVVFSISNLLFSGTKPLDGLAKEALDLAIKKSGKLTPTLENRL